MYEAIHERIATLAATTTYRCRYVIRVGAILINGDHDMGSMAEPRHALVHDLPTGVTDDVLDDYLSRLR